MKRHWIGFVFLSAATLACGTLAKESPSAANTAKLEAAQQQARAGNKTLIVLYTSCDRYSGTDSNVQARVNASGGGSTSWVTLDNAGNDRQRCDKDYYYVTFPPGSGSVLHLRTDSRLAGPSWKLARADVYPASQDKAPSQKNWGIWLGDRKYRGTWCEYHDTATHNCP